MGRGLDCAGQLNVFREGEFGPQFQGAFDQIIDDCQQRFATGTDHFGILAMLRGEITVEEQTGYPDHPFIGIRISWLKRF